MWDGQEEVTVEHLEYWVLEAQICGVFHEFVRLSTQPVRIQGQKLKRECKNFENRQDEAIKSFVRTS